MAAIDDVFSIVVGHEGGFSVTPADAGDWEGGVCGGGGVPGGGGKCLGTAWGVSTAAYPTDCRKLPAVLQRSMPPLVRDLTLTQAKELFRYNYWLPMQANTMPAPLSLIVTDAAFNNGTGRATQWLQQAVGAAVDGAIGPLTMGALSRALTASGPEHIAIEIMARRTTFMAALPKWPVFGLGWSRRLSALPYEAMRLAAAGT